LFLPVAFQPGQAGNMTAAGAIDPLSIPFRGLGGLQHDAVDRAGRKA
jgi:hypothetical protein